MAFRSNPAEKARPSAAITAPRTVSSAASPSKSPASSSSNVASMTFIGGWTRVTIAISAWRVNFSLVTSSSYCQVPNRKNRFILSFSLLLSMK